MATSPIYSWPEPDNTDLVKNGALAIRTLGDAIDTTMGTMVAKTIIDAKGDLIAGSAADTALRLAVGTNGQTLVADSTASTGLKWATPASGSTFVGCFASSRSAQSIANATFAAIALGTESYDTDAIHSTTNNSRFTIPSGKTGYWLFYQVLGYDPLPSGNMNLRFNKNGSFGSNQIGGLLYTGSTSATGLTTGTNISIFYLTAGDYIEMVVYQNSGGSANILVAGGEDFAYMGCQYLGA